MTTLALIPARGGSKGIPRKNLVSLGGKPLIAHSIAHALAAKRVDRTIVTTDDDEIASVARSVGAQVPFMRPKELGLDHVQDYPVFRHALEWLRDNEGWVPELVVQLRPTSPFRPPGLIDAALELMSRHPDADCLRTVTEAPITPYKMWTIDQAKTWMQPFAKLEGKESYNMPRQDLPKVYWHNGVLDVIRATTILEKGTIAGTKILPMEMEDDLYVLDIDRKTDVLVAEAALKEMETQANKRVDY